MTAIAGPFERSCVAPILAPLSEKGMNRLLMHLHLHVAATYTHSSNELEGYEMLPPSLPKRKNI